MKRENVLLHICCAPDATHSVNYLREEGYDVSGFFYNPCVHPEEEYKKRKAQAVRLAGEMAFPLIDDPYDSDAWFEQVKGLEDEPECGKRCEICYYMRFEKTAETGDLHGFEAFTTTLTISPHKKAAIINALGKQAGEKYGISFLPLNLKKQDGFKKSLELSKKYNLYRQHYCGCIYSMRGESSAL